MVYGKLLMLILLTSMPFLASLRIRRYKNIRFFMVKHMKKWMKIVKKVKDAKLVFFARMKRSRHYRKFFIIMVMLLTFVVQYVDLKISSTAASTALASVNRDGKDYVEIYGEALKFIPLSTSPIASFLAIGISLSMFSYRLFDRVLTRLHSSDKTFFIVAYSSVILTALSFRGILLVEVIFIILMAANYYPPLCEKPQPKGRKPLPVDNKILHKMAA